jgi:hypothetical protein
LAYKPSNRGFYYDAECPLMNDYIAQLADPQSEASTHLAQMSQQIRELEKSDAEFVDRNFAVDKHYFKLRRLAPKTASAKTWRSWKSWFGV